jgi:hypothetical protein
VTVALAHHHAAPAFNGLFYATVATVIPVLFLALAVQGRGFDRVLRAMQAPRHERGDPPPRSELGLFSPRVLMVTAWLILGSAFGGEATALFDLYRQRSPSGDGLVTLACVLFLLMAVAAGPVLSFDMVMAGLPASQLQRRRIAQTADTTQGSDREPDPEPGPERNPPPAATPPSETTPA